MKKSDVVKAILGVRYGQAPCVDAVQVFAPTNIALCKYWGKRDQELNLPVTSSLSVSLGEKGASAAFAVIAGEQDQIFLNDTPVSIDSGFALRLVAFLDLFRTASGARFLIRILSNIPIAAGLASSACGFASVVKALNQIYGWQLDDKSLSILARLGSGSASRSLWSGFVEWHAGQQADGMDSYAEPIAMEWPELCVGLLLVNTGEKGISSRVAMQQTVATSALYSAWPDKVSHDLQRIKQALVEKDFISLGEAAESNAMTMHATMLSAWPPITYAQPETLLAMQKVWHLRADGMSCYFTQDAGPNLKLLFLQKDQVALKSHFSDLICVAPFDL